MTTDGARDWRFRKDRKRRLWNVVRILGCVLQSPLCVIEAVNLGINDNFSTTKLGCPSRNTTAATTHILAHMTLRSSYKSSKELFSPKDPNCHAANTSHHLLLPSRCTCLGQLDGSTLHATYRET